MDKKRYTFGFSLTEKAFRQLRLIKNLLAKHNVKVGSKVIRQDSTPEEIMQVAMMVLERVVAESFHPKGNPNKTVKELLPEWWKS